MSSIASYSPPPPASREFRAAEEEAMDEEYNWESEANFDQRPLSQPDSPQNLNGQSYGSLTLPPINQNTNLDHLPSLNDPDFFDPDYDYEHYHNFSPAENESPLRDLAPQGGTPPLSSSQYGIIDNDFNLEDLWNWDRTPPPQMAPSGNGRNTRSGSSVVDLTSSPVRSARKPSRKRKADSPGEGRVSKTARKNSSSSVEVDLDNVPVVDLSGVDDTSQYEKLRQKEQAELQKQQTLAEANKPVKLAEFQCIICMDNPTDLTVTHCGMCFSCLFYYIQMLTMIQDISSAPNVSTKLYMPAIRNVAPFVERQLLCRNLVQSLLGIVSSLWK